MKICRDGDSCETWFGADGSLICRHGFVAEPSNSTEIDWNCPLDLLYESEKRKWKQFFEELPRIMNKISEPLDAG